MSDNGAEATTAKESFGEKLEHAAEDVLKVIKYPITFAEKAAKVLATAEQLDPQLKTTLAELVTKAEAIATAGTTAASGDGVNFAADASAVADVEAFFVFVKTSVVPQLETAYEALKTDLT